MTEDEITELKFCHICDKLDDIIARLNSLDRHVRALEIENSSLKSQFRVTTAMGAAIIATLASIMIASHLGG